MMIVVLGLELSSAPPRSVKSNLLSLEVVSRGFVKGFNHGKPSKRVIEIDGFLVGKVVTDGHAGGGIGLFSNHCRRVDIDVIDADVN